MTEETPIATREAVGYTFYLDEYRVEKGLAANERAAVLSARLGHATRAWLADLRGDVLVLGCDGRMDDADVPWLVVDAALRSGLAVEGVRVSRGTGRGFGRGVAIPLS